MVLFVLGVGTVVLSGAFEVVVGFVTGLAYLAICFPSPVVSSLFIAVSMSSGCSSGVFFFLFLFMR